MVGTPPGLGSALFTSCRVTASCSLLQKKSRHRKAFLTTRHRRHTEPPSVSQKPPSWCRDTACNASSTTASSSVRCASFAGPRSAPTSGAYPRPQRTLHWCTVLDDADKILDMAFEPQKSEPLSTESDQTSGQIKSELCVRGAD